jgi:ABC-type transport system involved in cytochrome c biogenesis permease subunit
MAETALGLLLAASVLFAFARRRPRVYRPAALLTIAAGVLLLALIVYRSVWIGFPALTGTYEGLLFLAGMIAVVLPLLGRRVSRPLPVVMAAGTFVAFLLLVVLVSPVISDELKPPVPILRSYWLVVHVAFAFVGLALFTVGAVAGATGLLTSPDKPTEAKLADRVRDDAIALGFVFYATGGLVFGAIWAEAAWGRFWGWDPKETWALVTSIVYAVYLHLRYIRKVRTAVARWLSIVAWIVAGFTFWGVNFLLRGLHSYG